MYEGDHRHAGEHDEDLGLSKRSGSRGAQEKRDDARRTSPNPEAGEVPRLTGRVGSKEPTRANTNERSPMLASWGPVADSEVYALLCARAHCRDPRAHGQHSRLDQLEASGLVCGERVHKTQGSFAWCLDLDEWPVFWYAGNAFLIADDHVTLERRCNQLLHAANEYGCQFSASSLETMNNVGDRRPVRLDNGRTFARKARIKVLGSTVDAQGSMAAVIQARESVAMPVWFNM